MHPSRLLHDRSGVSPFRPPRGEGALPRAGTYQTRFKPPASSLPIKRVEVGSAGSFRESSRRGSSAGAQHSVTEAPRTRRPLPHETYTADAERAAGDAVMGIRRGVFCTAGPAATGGSLPWAQEVEAAGAALAFRRERPSRHGPSTDDPRLSADRACFFPVDQTSAGDASSSAAASQRGRPSSSTSFLGTSASDAGTHPVKSLPKR